MKAWRTTPETNPGGVALLEVAEPTPAEGEILVRVKAASLNQGDFLQRNGRPDPRFPSGVGLTLGVECAGVVERVGAGVDAWREGDAVMGRCSGGLAQLTTMKAGMAMPKPDGLPWAAAATMHVLVVAHDALFTRAQLAPDEWLLVNAASSGIGIASLQLGKHLARAKVIATTTSAAKSARLRDIGADVVLGADDPDWPDQLRTATGGKGVDVIADSVGASAFAGNMKSLGIEGRLVSIGRLGGAAAELNLDLLALHRIRLIGVTNRTRTLAEQEGLVAAFRREVLPWLADGTLVPIVDRTFDFPDAESGWTMLGRRDQVGKLVVVL